MNLGRFGKWASINLTPDDVLRVCRESPKTDVLVGTEIWTVG